MDKIIEFIKEADNNLAGFITLLIAGVLVALVGATICTVSKALAFCIVGGLIIVIGVIFVICGLVCLFEFLSNM